MLRVQKKAFWVKVLFSARTHTKITKVQRTQRKAVTCANTKANTMNHPNLARMKTTARNAHYTAF